MMTRNTADEIEPIYTSTRVPPAERVGRASDRGVDAEPASDDDPVFVTRMAPEVTRVG